jgi:hypothetical protein
MLIEVAMLPIYICFVIDWSERSRETWGSMGLYRYAPADQRFIREPCQWLNSRGIRRLVSWSRYISGDRSAEIRR